MSKALTEVEARSWLEKNLSYIQLESWGGKSSAISKFHNTENGNTLSCRFSKLKARQRQGSTIGAGTGQAQTTTMTENSAANWLEHNFPYVTILRWGGASSYKSTFYNAKAEKIFFTVFANLRHYLRLGVNVGAGCNSKQLTKEQVQKKLPSHITILEYNGSTSKSIYYDQNRDQKFSYFYSSLMSMLKRDPDFVPCSPNSSLERLVQEYLISLDIPFLSNSTVSNWRPDFVIPKHKLIIECDGLYWHSDKIVSRRYHRAKYLTYLDEGYRSLFFRENELLNSFETVKSIIDNALGINKQIYAQKCVLGILDSKFFEDNHLMDSGTGKCFGLFYKGTVVAGVQACWLRKDAKELDVSRFCCTPSVTVVDGFSKLLKHVESIYEPKIIRTFTDLRYETNKCLPSLGFVHKGTHLSFRWVKGQHCFHRIKFPENTGYDHGYSKLWDCGQARWVKIV